MKSRSATYQLLVTKLLVVIFVSCQTHSSHVEESILTLEKEGSTAFIAASQSIDIGRLKNDIDAIRRDSILEITGFITDDKVLDYAKAYKTFSNIIHLDFKLPTELFLKKEDIKLNTLKNIEELDLTKFERLKAVSISGYDFDTLELLIEKISEVDALELLTLNLTPHHSFFQNNRTSFKTLFALPNSLCEVKVNTLKFIGKRSNFSNAVTIEDECPYYSSITLPSCFNLTKAKKIAYHQEDAKRQDAQDFILFKKNKARFKASKAETIESHMTFIQDLFKVKSLEHLTINNAFIDSLPKTIGDLKLLKELSISNSYVSYFPKEIEALNALNTLKIYDSTSEVYFDSKVKGLQNLKELRFVNTSLSNGFPNFSEVNSLEHLIFTDQYSVSQVPKFLSRQSSLQTLIWRYTNVTSMPDLNECSPKMINIDNNKITHIDNILDVAKKAAYFSYDINDVPFHKRADYNKEIYGSSLRNASVEARENLDSLYALREIPFARKKQSNVKELVGNQNSVINKISVIGSEFTPLNSSDLKKDKLFAAIKNKERYGTVSFQNELFSDPEIEQLDMVFDLVERYDLEPLHVYKLVTANNRETLPRFPLSAIDELDNELISYNGSEYLVYPFTIEGERFDYGLLKHLRSAKVNGQSGLNNITKVKGLRFLEIKNIEHVNTIPECFCELTELDSVYVRDSARKKFNDQYHLIQMEAFGERTIISKDSLIAMHKANQINQEEMDDLMASYNNENALRQDMKSFRDRTLFQYDHIQIPDCIKKMKFKTVSYSGMTQKN